MKIFEKYIISNTLQEQFSPAASDDLDYLIQTNYPITIIDFYKSFEPMECHDINGAIICPVTDIKEENSIYVPGCIIYDQGYRVIGTSDVGDIYCIKANDLSSGNNCYLASHDSIHEDLHTKELEEFVIKICNNFNEFIELYLSNNLIIDFHDLETSF